MRKVCAERGRPCGDPASKVVHHPSGGPEGRQACLGMGNGPGARDDHPVSTEGWHLLLEEILRSAFRKGHFRNVGIVLWKLR